MCTQERAWGSRRTGGGLEAKAENMLVLALSFVWTFSLLEKKTLPVDFLTFEAMKLGRKMMGREGQRRMGAQSESFVGEVPAALAS